MGTKYIVWRKFPGTGDDLIGEYRTKAGAEAAMVAHPEVFASWLLTTGRVDTLEEGREKAARYTYAIDKIEWA